MTFAIRAARGTLLAAVSLTAILTGLGVRAEEAVSTAPPPIMAFATIQADF